MLKEIRLCDPDLDYSSLGQIVDLVRENGELKTQIHVLQRRLDELEKENVELKTKMKVPS